MKKTIRISALLVAFVMIVTLASCKKTEEKANDIWQNAVYTQNVTLGDGEKTIDIKVEAGDNAITFTILTDCETLGEALKEHSLIEGEDSEYGMYVKTVNGILADYDIDGYYWSITKSGEYLMSGVDTTEISSGESYEFTRTK